MFNWSRSKCIYASSVPKAPGSPFGFSFVAHPSTLVLHKINCKHAHKPRISNTVTYYICGRHSAPSYICTCGDRMLQLEATIFMDLRPAASDGSVWFSLWKLRLDGPARVLFVFEGALVVHPVEFWISITNVLTFLGGNIFCVIVFKGVLNVDSPPIN